MPDGHDSVGSDAFESCPTGKSHYEAEFWTMLGLDDLKREVHILHRLLPSYALVGDADVPGCRSLRPQARW